MCSAVAPHPLVIGTVAWCSTAKVWTLDLLIWHLAAVKYSYIIFLCAVAIHPDGRRSSLIALSVPPAIWQLATTFSATIWRFQASYLLHLFFSLLPPAAVVYLKLLGSYTICTSILGTFDTNVFRASHYIEINRPKQQS